MQNITAARLLPGFLRLAAGEWCAPLFWVRAFGLLSRLRFSAAWVGFGVRDRGVAEVGWGWLWALPPIASERESVKTNQRKQATSEATLENKDGSFVHPRQEAAIKTGERRVMEYLLSPRQSHVSVSIKERRQTIIAGSGTRTVGLQNTSNNNFIG